jgi:hypothetical protein
MLPDGPTSETAVRSAESDIVAHRRYFQEAIGLRLSLQSNADDHFFASNGGRIIYLMDANVVVFFMNPVVEAVHVNVFDSGDSGATAGTALITAEFLFSRGLSGQQGYPALIAPAHAEELGDLVGSMRQRLETPATAPDLLSPVNTPSASSPMAAPHTLPGSTLEELKILIQQVRAGSMQRPLAVKRLRRLVPELATDLLEGGIQEANQLLRLYRNDLIRPLAVHSEAATDILEIGQIQSSRVKKWGEDILQERKRIVEDRIQRSARKRNMRPPSLYAERKKARRDAEALLQTMALDEAADQAGENTRYVLVTADRALFDTYSRWFWQGSRSEGAEPRFVLRHPLQYVPILNVTDMPNGIERSDILDRTRDALDALLAPLRSVDRNYPHTLSIHRILARMIEDDQKFQEALKNLYGQNPFELKAGSTSLLENIRRDWEEGFRAGIVLNAELMQRRAHSEFEPLARLLNEQVDLRAAILQDHQSILSLLEAAHVTVNTRISMTRLMRDTNGETAAPPQRGIMAIRATFPRIVGDASLDDVLERLAAGKDVELESRIENTLRTRLDHQAHFFAACLAHRCSRWQSALQHANRALALLEQELASSNMESFESELYEIGYLAASATRYALPSVEAIRRAITLLTRGMAYARRSKDKFGLARALCEFSALVLVIGYRENLLGQMPDAPSPFEIEDFRQLPRQIEEARTAVVGLTELPNGLCTKPIEVLQSQMWSNVVSAEVLSHLMGEAMETSKVIRPRFALLNEALTATEKRLAVQQCPPVVEAEYTMAQFWNGLLSGAGARQSLRASRERANADRHRLTDLDRAEFERFEAILDI